MAEKFYGRCFNYESPISVFATDNIVNSVIERAAADFAKKADEQIYQAVLNVGVNVSEEELEKALRYDRGQYEKGYADGLKNADIVHGRWNRESILNCGYICSECDGCLDDEHISINISHYHYCPFCGAFMDGERR